MEKYNCDLLVVGGGLAGLVAAIEAAKLGQDVTLLSKCWTGKSGNTVISEANFALGIAGDGSEDSPQLFSEDILRSGRGVNDPNLVQIFSKEAFEAVPLLEEYGIKLVHTDGKPAKKQPPGHSAPRFLSVKNVHYSYHLKGMNITDQLVKKAADYNVKILNNQCVIEILTENNTAQGVLALDKKTGKVACFLAKAIVLTAGGGGRIFKRTNNVRDITGDSYGLALSAGCKLRDMEFIQFYPTMSVWPIKIPVTNSLLSAGAFLQNADNERFMQRYDPRGDLATRDVMSRAIFKEISEGRGVNGCVYLNFSEIPAETFTRDYSWLKNVFDKRGFNFKSDRLLIQPTTHFFCGGIAVNEKLQTNVEGLFAAGEAVGGLHGSNRLPGTALAEALVFGRRAAVNSVNYSKNIEKRNKFQGRSFRPQARGGTIKLQEISAQLRNIMWNNASILRDKKSLQKALQVVLECNLLLNKAGVGSPLEVVKYYETKNMCLAAQAIINSALFRQESRGSHFREDYQNEREEYSGKNSVSFLDDSKSEIIVKMF
ncbi:MAG: L-aspartate oxidase [Clostridiales bacterium]|jgi:succinate dehydrogenase/fumarate reductase flavoprotein subunit|nr:L-aspartate oxidase [Clostridiales bacterium]